MRVFLNRVQVGYFVAKRYGLVTFYGERVFCEKTDIGGLRVDCPDNFEDRAVNLLAESCNHRAVEREPMDFFEVLGRRYSQVGERGDGVLVGGIELLSGVSRGKIIC